MPSIDPPISSPASAMNEEYDAIVLGAGLKELFLSRMLSLSVSGKKIRHLDRNNYYGGEMGAQMMLVRGKKPPDDWSGDQYKYKSHVASGALVKLLIHTGAVDTLKFKTIEESFIYQESGLYKLTMDEMANVNSILTLICRRPRFHEFLHWVQNFDPVNDTTWDGLDPRTTTMQQVYHKFGLEESTADFPRQMQNSVINHQQPPPPPLTTTFTASVKKIRLYSDLLARSVKPNLCPLYGLDQLPDSFNRMCADYASSYRPAKPVQEIVFEGGRVVGVKNGDDFVKCRQVYCDPSNAPLDMLHKKTGQAVRGVFLLDHTIPNTNDAQSCQIIMPKEQIGRQYDIEITLIPNGHGWFVAIVSTTLETSNVNAEILPAMQLLQPISQEFVSVSDVFEPLDAAADSSMFISKTYDPTTHFELTYKDVLDIFKRGTTTHFDFSKIGTTTHFDFEVHEEGGEEGAVDGEEEGEQAASSSSSVALPEFTADHPFLFIVASGQELLCLGRFCSPDSA